MTDTKRPNWTLTYPTPAGQWKGTGYEFFDDRDAADARVKDLSLHGHTAKVERYLEGTDHLALQSSEGNISREAVLFMALTVSRFLDDACRPAQGPNIAVLADTMSAVYHDLLDYPERFDPEKCRCRRVQRRNWTHERDGS